MGQELGRGFFAPVRFGEYVDLESEELDSNEDVVGEPVCEILTRLVRSGFLPFQRPLDPLPKWVEKMETESARSHYKLLWKGVVR